MLLAREEMINDIATAINQSHVPLPVVESVLKDMLNEVRIAIQQQYVKEKELYEKSLKEDDADEEIRD